jgi:DNA-binding CsgD family transcriptional regulator
VITRAVLFEQFTGRAPELQFLVDFRSRSGREARGGAVVISGESGVGKTRLLQEFRQAIERERGGIAFVRCDEAQARPYGPFIEVLEKIGTARELRSASSIEPALHALTNASAVTVEDALEQRLQRISALRAALEDAAKRLGHLTVIVDDLHASDLASLDALRGLTASAKRLPFALVLAYRTDDIAADIARSTALALIEREGVDRIVVQALPRRALAKSLRALLPAASTATIGRICDLSEGKPYVAEELARSIVERGGDSEIQPTLSLRTAVLGRVDALDAVSRDIVRRAAVLGSVVRIDDMISDGAARQDVVRALRAARDLQLIEEQRLGGEPAFRFRHAITREILYADLLDVERHAIHLAAADRLQREKPERLAEIAYHLDASGATERARDASERAGDRAVEVAAFADAVALYVRAVERTEPEHPDDLLRVAEKFLVALDGAGGLDERYDFFEHTCERLERAGRRADAFALRVRALKIFATYESPRTASMLPRVRAGAPDETPLELRFDAAIAIFHALVLEYRFEDAVSALDDAQRIAPEPSPSQLGKILIAKTILAFHWYGDPAAAERFIHETRDLARGSGNDRRFANSTKNLSTIAAERGEFREALCFANEASEAFAKAGFGRWAGKAAGVAAMFATQLGDFASAQRSLAATDDESLREREWIVTRALLARAIGGERTELEAALRDGIARRDTIFVRHLAAELAWSASTADEARSIVRAALGAAPSLDTDMDMADAVVAFGDPEAVARVAEHISALDLTEANVLSRAGKHLIEARLAAREHRSLAAAESARAAETLYARMGLWAQRAQALRLAGRAAEARDLLREIGATAELARFGEDPRPATASGIALSQREEQVARLAASGLVAREIAENLAISPRTVETHLGNVYEKLHLRSRADLINYFA